MLCGKRLYLTKKDALTAKNYQMQNGKWIKPLYIYYCAKENGWHLTKKIKISNVRFSRTTAEKY